MYRKVTIRALRFEWKPEDIQFFESIGIRVKSPGDNISLKDDDERLPLIYDRYDIDAVDIPWRVPYYPKNGEHGMTYHYVKLWTEEDLSFFNSLGLSLYSLFSLPIREDDSRFSAVEDYLNAVPHNKPVICRQYTYKYSRTDIEDSEYFLLDQMPYIGYPPEDYFEQSFDMDRCCPKCKNNHYQISDLRISKVSKKDMWSYFAWRADTIFVKEDLYKEVFEPLGIGKRSVRFYSGKIREGIYQLDLPISDEPLEFRDASREDPCPLCGTAKPCFRCSVYPFFPIQEHPLPNMYMSKECYGGGCSSNRYIFISKAIAKALVERKILKWDDLIPCRPDPWKDLKREDYWVY